MPSFWLVKSEPTKYAFADLQRDGKTVWDGVRNNAAALHLKAMKARRRGALLPLAGGPGGGGRGQGGAEAFPDASDPAGRFVAVELAPVRALKRRSPWPR